MLKSSSQAISLSSGASTAGDEKKQQGPLAEGAFVPEGPLAPEGPFAPEAPFAKHAELPIGIRREVRRGPLSLLIAEHLRANGLRQIDFCRQSGFDQGLLSKILSSVVNTLNVETALRLAEAMNLPPVVVFEAIGKKDIDDMLRKFYSKS